MPRESTLKETHRRFVAECHANDYTAKETTVLLEKHYGAIAPEPAIAKLFAILKHNAHKISKALTDQSLTVTLDNIHHAIEVINPRIKKYAGAIESYLHESMKIKEDPSYGIPYADKRKRMRKLSDNIKELDEPKTLAIGSFPTHRAPDGTTTFKEFEIKNKDHGEQRKSIEAIGKLADGNLGGDVIINVFDPSLSEADPVVPEEKKETEE